MPITSHKLLRCSLLKIAFKITFTEDGDGAEIRNFKQLEVRYVGLRLKSITETV